MQKVLFVASTYSHIRNFHLPYLREFRARGWEVYVACTNAPTEHPDCIDHIVELPFEKKMTSPANFRAASLLRRLYAAERFDLIVTHTSLAAFFARLALPSKNAARVINMTHGYLYDDATSAPKRALLRTAERLVARKTDLVLAMNAWDYAEAQRYDLGAEVRLVPGVGVDFARAETADIRTKFGISDDEFVLFYAAEFSARKNQSMLIRAMQQLPPRVRLVLAGDGALKRDCERLADELGVAERVVFPGHVENVAEWLAASDAAVSSSRIEGLPFNIMEAMHAGLPVVASDVKGHADLIEHGRTGLLYPYDDARAFAAQVEVLLASPERCGALGGAAAQVVERYALERVLPQVMGEYERVAETIKQ